MKGVSRLSTRLIYMAGKKYQSCLVPFENEILTLRRRRPPMPFTQIAEYLKEKHQVSVRRQTIETFLKIRARGFKPCKYAWNIEPASTENQPAIKKTSSALSNQTVSAVQEASKQQSTENPTKYETDDWENQPFEMEYSETYNLHRLPPEVAAARNKIIEQKIWEKYHKNRQPRNC